MKTIAFETLADWAERPDTGWSIGTFGAVGEFVRDPSEPADVRRSADQVEVVTPRGGLRIVAAEDTPATAWDSLSTDGETWGHALAVCTPVEAAKRPFGICEIGPDREALNEGDRDALLFDLGVGVGNVWMTVRTRDAGLLAALRAVIGQSVLQRPTVVADMLRVQPHRVLLSPLGRIEVFQPIPRPDGESPPGPHTHLLPKLIAKGRPHSANTPVPDGWQPALTIHPPSPWRTASGERKPFDAAADAAFAPLLARYQCAEDVEAVRRLSAALDGGAEPNDALWPTTRRGRTKARIWLRRRHAAGDPRAAPWRARFAHLEASADDAVDEEPA